MNPRRIQLFVARLSIGADRKTRWVILEADEGFKVCFGSVFASLCLLCFISWLTILQNERF